MIHLKLLYQLPLKLFIVLPAFLLGLSYKNLKNEYNDAITESKKASANNKVYDRYEKYHYNEGEMSKLDMFIKKILFKE